MWKNWTYSWRLCFLKKLPQFFPRWSSARIMGILTAGPAVKNHISPKKGKRIDCKISNYVPLVVPGLSTSSSTTPTPTFASSSSQDSVFDESRDTKNRLNFPLPNSSPLSPHRDHSDNLSDLVSCCSVIGPVSTFQSCRPKGATIVGTKCWAFCVPRLVQTRDVAEARDRTSWRDRLLFVPSVCSVLCHQCLQHMCSAARTCQRTRVGSSRSQRGSHTFKLCRVGHNASHDREIRGVDEARGQHHARWSRLREGDRNPHVHCAARCSRSRRAKQCNTPWIVAVHDHVWGRRVWNGLAVCETQFESAFLWPWSYTVRGGQGGHDERRQAKVNVRSRSVNNMTPTDKATFAQTGLCCGQNTRFFANFFPCHLRSLMVTRFAPWSHKRFHQGHCKFGVPDPTGGDAGSHDLGQAHGGEHKRGRRSDHHCRHHHKLHHLNIWTDIRVLCTWPGGAVNTLQEFTPRIVSLCWSVQLLVCCMLELVGIVLTQWRRHACGGQIIHWDNLRGRGPRWL